MSPATADDSSAISESRRMSIHSRDGGLCVLCGMDPVDVGHIIARNSGDQDKVNWICGVAPSLSNFRKNDAANLEASSVFVQLITRELLLEHEHHDFVMRQAILAGGGRDPGRTFPLGLIDEFEYIPVRDGPFRIHIHNPTPYDSNTFVFDNFDHRPCPLLHFQASHIALMVEAQSHLSSVTRRKSPKGDVAEPQITTLLQLYRRQAGPGPVKAPMSIAADYDAFCTQLALLNTQPSARILTTIPGSPPLNAAPPAYSVSFAKDMPGLVPSSSASTDVSHTEDSDDPYAGDIQLAEYAKEPSVTWEDLKNRPPLFGGEALGPWRFASADDICRQFGSLLL